MPLPELLERLLTTPGPSGQERAAAAVWREAAAPVGEVSSDVLGSSWVRVPGTAGGPSLAVVGHIDEIGVVVTHLGDDGMAAVRQVGGFNPAVMVGQRVDVLTRDGPLPGVVVARVQKQRRGRGEERKAIEYDDLVLDVGAKDGDELQEARASRGRGALARRAARAGRQPRRLAGVRQQDRLLRRARGRAAARGGGRERPATSSRSPPCRRRSATSRARARPRSPPSRRSRSRSTSRTRTTSAAAIRRTRARSSSAAARRCRAGRRSIRRLRAPVRDRRGGEDPVRGRGLARHDEHRRRRRLPQPRGRRHGPRLGAAPLHALADRDRSTSTTSSGRCSSSSRSRAGSSLD